MLSSTHMELSKVEAESERSGMKSTWITEVLHEVNASLSQEGIDTIVQTEEIANLMEGLYKKVSGPGDICWR